MKRSQLNAIRYSYARKEQEKVEQQLEEMGCLKFFPYSTYKTKKGFLNALLGSKTLRVAEGFVAEIKNDMMDVEKQFNGMKNSGKCSPKSLEGIQNKFNDITKLYQDAYQYMKQLEGGNN